MLRARVMPCLLLKNAALVKTIQFRDPSYVGDPINAIRIYNEREVDELIVLDISATPERKPPPFAILRDVASECFMPLCYGGGVRTLADAERIYTLGIEKVAINTHAAERPAFVTELAGRFGSQSVVVAIDVALSPTGGYEVFIRGGRESIGREPADYARQIQDLGAGEIVLTSIDRDGTMSGYDIDLIRRVTAAVSVPVIACGGAGQLQDLRAAVDGGASAAAAGSLVIYHGRNRAVLINFPSRRELERVFG
jgi:cyclase